MSVCVVLNSSFEPLRPATMRRALRLVLDGKAEILQRDESRPVFSGDSSVDRPLVIRLKKYVNVPRVFRKTVSNTFLFARDGPRGCAYCGRKAHQLRGREQMTRDHVFPKSRGGTDTWDNCVMSCSSCNTRKSNLTPVEANMPLRYQPTTPTYVHLAWNIRKLTAAQKAFVTELFGPDWMQYAER